MPLAQRRAPWGRTRPDFWAATPFELRAHVLRLPSPTAARTFVCDVARLRAKLGQFRRKFSQLRSECCAKFGRIWSKLAESWSIPGRIKPSPSQLLSKVIGLGPTSAECGPNFADSGQRLLDSKPNLTAPGRTLTGSMPNFAEFAEIAAHLGDTRPKSIELSRPRLRPSGRFGQRWAFASEIGPTWASNRPEVRVFEHNNEGMLRERYILTKRKVDERKNKMHHKWGPPDPQSKMYKTGNRNDWGGRGGQAGSPKFDSSRKAGTLAGVAARGTKRDAVTKAMGTSEAAAQ